MGDARARTPRSTCAATAVPRAAPRRAAAARSGRCRHPGSSAGAMRRRRACRRRRRSVHDARSASPGGTRSRRSLEAGATSAGHDLYRTCASARSAASSKAAGPTGAPVACCIQRSGVRLPICGHALELAAQVPGALDLLLDLERDEMADRVVGQIERAIDHVRVDAEERDVALAEDRRVVLGSRCPARCPTVASRSSAGVASGCVVHPVPHGACRRARRRRSRTCPRSR